MLSAHKVVTLEALGPGSVLVSRKKAPFTRMHLMYRKSNCIKFGEDISQSSGLKICLDFRYVASFPNEGDSEGDMIENQGQISDFHPPPTKIREGVGKMSECYFQLEPRTQPLVHFVGGGVVLAELGD